MTWIESDPDVIVGYASAKGGRWAGSVASPNESQQNDPMVLLLRRCLVMIWAHPVSEMIPQVGVEVDE